jgi:hypothetical protein
MHGRKEDQTPLLMSFKQALEADGHHLIVYEMGKEGQKIILLEIDKQAHALTIKHSGVPAGDPQRVYKTPVNLYEVLYAYPDDALFLCGYTLVLKHVPVLVQTLKPVFSSDAAHMRGELGGTAFGTWGQDANKNMVNIALSVFFDNESKDTWALHFASVKKLVSAFDVTGNILIADGDKGFAAAFEGTFSRCKKFMCERHRSENLVKYCPKGTFHILPGCTCHDCCRP